MARLNEPTAPLESLESIKRRYLRQNRDLAKTNSIQSIRIRALESEISRLLTENLELREEILQLRNNVEDRHYEYNDGRSTDFQGLKGRLEDKLQEIGSLIAELGNIKAHPKVGGQRIALARPVRCEVEALEEAERRLPSIAENKSWPAIPTGNAELKDSPASATDSFELEPPPIAHFCDDDMGMLQHAYTSDSPLSPLNKNLPEHGLSDSEKFPEAHAVNLETRKKRRESVQPKRVMMFEESPAKLSTTSTSQGASLRTGAKRKLSSKGDDQISEASRKGVARDSAQKASPEEVKKLYQKVPRPLEPRPLSSIKLERKAFAESK
jgi:hypothetical protein